MRLRSLLLGSLTLTCLAAGNGAFGQTLQDALVAAYRGNPQLEADRARQRATDEDVSRAWGAYRPQVVASGEYGRAHDRVAIPALDFFGNRTQELFHPERGPNQEALQVKQAIWDGNRGLSDITHSKWAVANGRATLISTEQAVLGGAVQAYYDLYRDQKIVEIQREFVKSLEDEHKAALRRYGVKDVTRTDVAQSEARLARGIADLKQYEGNLETSRSAFMLAVGFAPGYLPEPPLPPVSLLPANVDDALALTEDNPDLKAAIYAEKAAEADIDTAESQMMPDLSVLASKTHSDHSDYTNTEITSSQVMLTLTVPIYDGGVASARTRIAKHAYGQRRLTTDLQRIRTEDAIKRSWQNYQATRARITALEENERSAQIALDGVQQELKVGSRTVLDELNARQEVLDAQIGLLRSRHDAVISAYSLLVACGRLTAQSLGLPVQIYDPAEHYESASWVPWNPWIDQDYPEPTKVPDGAIPGGWPLESFVPDIEWPDLGLPSLFSDGDDAKK